MRGRWLNRDPLKNAELRQGANLYEYVGNNPVGRTDPSGLLFGGYPIACVVCVSCAGVQGLSLAS
jgi:uncharacterized protein RhaS with RHS repeats